MPAVTPVPVVPATVFVTPVPLITGSAFVAVNACTTPRSVIDAPPSAVTLPPSVAPVVVTDALVGVVTVGVWSTPSSRMTQTSVAMMLARAAAAAPGEYRNPWAPRERLLRSSWASQPMSVAS